MNIQYAIAKDKVYVIEANPRASRTVPIVSKVCNISMARIATEILMAEATGNEKFNVSKLSTGTISHYGVKEAVFPFNMFQEVDPILGPEMRSTGEVLGLADSFGLAFFKAQEATQVSLPVSGSVLISVKEQDRSDVLEVAQKFADLGFNIRATAGTCKFLNTNGVDAKVIEKLNEGRPNILDAITNKEINLIINTPVGKRSQNDDSYIRKAAIKHKIPYITTVAAAKASAKGIEAYKASLENKYEVKHLQSYHAGIEV
jgi:carbamoyl-phosphate synthase large subunit